MVRLSNVPMRPTSSLRLTTWISSLDRREKSRSCCVNSAARLTADSVALTNSIAAGESVNLIKARLDETMVSRLLKSKVQLAAQLTNRFHFLRLDQFIFKSLGFGNVIKGIEMPMIGSFVIDDPSYERLGRLASGSLALALRILVRLTASLQPAG